MTAISPASLPPYAPVFKPSTPVQAQVPNLQHTVTPQTGSDSDGDNDGSGVNISA